MNRQKTIIKTSIFGILTNLTLVAAKAIVGFLSNSLAIILEAINNATDIISSVVTIVGAKLAGRAPDREHPYGHGRIEYISAFGVGLIIFGAGIGAAKESIPKIFNPPTAHYSAATITIMVIAIIAKIILGRHYRKIGKKVDSDSLTASGTDALFDAALSTATLASIIVNIFTDYNLEGVMGVAISVFIVKASIAVLREAWRDLIGRRVDSELSLAIKKRVLEFDKVIGAYDLQLHNYGPTQVIGSIFIQVPDETTAREIHKITRNISEAIYKEYHVSLTIGIYAENTNTKHHSNLYKTLTDIIAKYPEVKQMHGFYVDDINHIIAFDIIFDIAYPTKNRTRNRILRDMRKHYKGYSYKVAIDIDDTDK